MRAPYLSIVIAARNDAHGTHFIQRFALSLRTLYKQARKYQLPVEVIIVEWNPPSHAPGLSQVLPRPQSPTQVRYLQVPAAWHQRYRSASHVALFQMIAKNVGIRRARSPFVLCTNADIIYSDALFAYLAQKKLHSQRVYRCTRCDVPAWEPHYDTLPYGALLQFFRKKILRRLGKNRWLAYLPMSGKVWFASLPMQLLSAVISQILRLCLREQSNRINSLDTWACGDFTLMHQKAWHRITGYAELDAYSLHIDSLALGAAVAVGIKQVILPQSHCTYHMSHENSWEESDIMKKVNMDLSLPKLDYSTLCMLLAHMMRQKEIIAFNKPNWGFHEIHIPEIHISETHISETHACHQPQPCAAPPLS